MIAYPAIVHVAPTFMFAEAYNFLQCTSPVTPNDPFWSTSKFGAADDTVKRAPAPRARPPQPLMCREFIVQKTRVYICKI